MLLIQLCWTMVEKKLPKYDSEDTWDRTGANLTDRTSDIMTVVTKKVNVTQRSPY